MKNYTPYTPGTMLFLLPVAVVFLQSEKQEANRILAGLNWEFQQAAFDIKWKIFCGEVSPVGW